jgi:hypothetical protein
VTEALKRLGDDDRAFVAPMIAAILHMKRLLRSIRMGPAVYFAHLARAKEVRSRG